MIDGDSGARSSAARIPRHGSVPAVVALLISALAAMAAPGLLDAATPTHDPPLLDPDLAAMAEPVRRGIAAYRELADELAAAAARGDDAADRTRLAQAYGQLGQLYHAHGQTEAALAAYANARRVDPAAHRWAYYLGILHQAAGKLDAARGELEAALALAPGDAPTRLRLGELALLERRLDDAERLFRAVLERESDSAAAWFGLGQVAAERRDASAAIEAFERVLALQPAASIAHYPLALAYRDRGDVERAREHLALRGETVVESRDPLVRELTTLSKLSALQVVLSQAADPAVAARDLVGFAIGQLAGVEGAPDYLEAALEQGRDGRAPGAFERARVFDVIGALLIERDRPEEAARALERALAVVPDLADAAVRLGNLLGRERRYDEALARYDGVLAREPQHAEAWLGRADALALLGRDRESLAALERLETIAPGQARVSLRVAATLERLGRGEQALARYREAVSLAANEAQAATAHAGVGRLLAARGEDEAAIDALATAARLDPRAVAPRLELGAVEAKLGRYADAAVHYGEAVVLDGRREDARVGEASALLLAGRWVEARARLEGGARALPESSTLRHLLARLLAACPDRTLRDGERALVLAEDLAGAGAASSFRETLAMALAESGRFDRAVAAQAAIIEASTAPGGSSAIVERLAANLDRYRRRETCCASDDPGTLLP